MNRRRMLALAATALVQGCASDPNVDQYLTPQADTDPLQRHFAMQQKLPDGPLVGGNQTHLFAEASLALPAMFQAMAQARDHINLEYYVFEDVQVHGRHLSELLVSQLGRGVAVNVIYDSFGSSATPATLFDTLRQAGARIIEFNPINPVAALTGHSPNDRDHRKLMVVDGRIGFVGGVNMARVYENPPSDAVPADGNADHAYWRDTAMLIQGPAVAELQKLFFATWKKQNGPPMAPATYFPTLRREGVQTIRIIGSEPGEQHPLYYISLELAIRTAQQRIFLSTGYFVPPHQEREDLAAAARRGVDLRLVLPRHTDVEAAVYAARAAYGDLLESGAQIYELQDAVLHSKLAVVDGAWTAIGSSNLDRRSVVFNNEVDAIVLGNDTAAQAESLLQRDMSRSAQITLERWRQRSFSERVDEMRARLWEYWM